MTDADLLTDLAVVAAAPARRVVAASAAALVVTIVDPELRAVRQRFRLRQQAERQRVQDAIDREASQASWRAWEQRRTGSVVSWRRPA